MIEIIGRKIILPILFSNDYTKREPNLLVRVGTHHTIDCPMTGIILAAPEMKLNFSYHCRSNGII